MSLKVSVTHCQVCGTLSVHWGRVIADSCSRCAETASIINSYLNEASNYQDLEEEFNALNDSDSFLNDLGLGSPSSPLDANPKRGLDLSSNNSSEPWKAHFDNADPVERIAMDALADLPDISAILEDDSLEDVNKKVPLLSSIRSTFLVGYNELMELLDDINLFLETPDSGWKYMSKLEGKKDVITSKIELLNSYIIEAHHLGMDLVDADEAIFCALAKIPEWWFEGKDDLPEGTAIFYFDGGMDFNQFTALTDNYTVRREIKT